MTDKTRIILDTDVGDDIDDALAMALILNSPELELLGVTTVFRNTNARAALAAGILAAYGRADVPVFAGTAQPIAGGADAGELPCQYAAIAHDDAIYPSGAVEFIIDTLEKDPDAVLVTIGPLTNAGLAVRLAPEVMRGARIVCMGGVFSRVFPEWNIMCDPEAARIVLEECGPELVGLDVTMQCRMTDADLDRVAASKRPQAPLLRGLIKLWQDSCGAKHPILHDPLAVGRLIEPSLLDMRRCRPRVITAAGETRGATYLDNTFADGLSDGPALAAQGVRDRDFIELFLRRVFD